MANADTSKWSGEGTFTQVLLDRLQQLDAVAFVRVEDAPAAPRPALYAHRQLAATFLGIRRRDDADLLTTTLADQALGLLAHCLLRHRPAPS